MAKHLERYAVGRATHGDRSSVIACQKFVEALLEKLMEFDFRNGPLRRAYVTFGKYVNKRLGDIMYETRSLAAWKRPAIAQGEAPFSGPEKDLENYPAQDGRVRRQARASHQEMP